MEKINKGYIFRLYLDELQKRLIETYYVSINIMFEVLKKI